MNTAHALRWSRVALIALVGCASNPPAQPTTPPPSETPPPATQTEVDAGAPAQTPPAQAELPPMPEGLHGPPRPWAQMSDQEKGHYMAESVVPAMRALLQAYDAQRFAQVNCATCHGPNAREVHFHMPNSLPALPQPGGEQWNGWMHRDPRMFQFMMQRVMPAQAQLLGMQPFNPQTRTGFGCFNCHPHAGS